MKRVDVVIAAIFSLLLGGTALAYAQHQQQTEKPKQGQQADKQAKPKPARPATPKADGERHTQQQAQPRAARQRTPEQRTAQLRQQGRTAQYRFHSDYLERLRRQQMSFRSRPSDYYRNPYFLMPPIYFYVRLGRYYEINQFGADVLRQAANDGYDQGIRAGEADRLDRWPYSYEDCFAYQDASYGYDGYFVERDDYQFYFREGFRRGYDDGYYGRYRYGIYVNGSYSLLDSVALQVLAFQPIR